MASNRPIFVSSNGYDRPLKRDRTQSDLYDESYGPIQGGARVKGPLHEKEKTRRLSCKECRRLKLKCDRVFPCQSCVKRGCAEICPEGVLTGGRGSRFILQNTEQLHDKIGQLTERIRRLEGGLEDTYSQVSEASHPLLTSDLLAIKNTHGPEPSLNISHTDTEPRRESVRPLDGSQSIGSPSEIEDELHQAVQNVSLQEPHYISTEEGSPLDARDHISAALHPDIVKLSKTFPFPWVVDISVREKIRGALPAVEEAKRLCQVAERNALWQFNLNPSESFIPNLIHYCYTTPVPHLNPRRLATLLMILGIGSLVDPSRPDGQAHADAYHHLSRASLCEIPLMEEPDVDTLHTLMFMLWWYLIFWDDRKAIGYAWNILGFTAKLALALGIHRSLAKGKRLPEEDEKRRAIFWELLNVDYRLSLSMGRPPSLHLEHVHIPPPSYIAEGIALPQEEILYHEWKYSFLQNCLQPCLNAMVGSQPIEYDDILQLDIQFRDFPVPPLLAKDDITYPNPRSLTMQRVLVSNSRDIAILQLHRRYLTEAMNSAGTSHLYHKYAPSVVATYLSATSLIASVEMLFHQERDLSSKFLIFWFNAFSSAVTLGLIIQRLPPSRITDYALSSFAKCFSLFTRAAPLVNFVERSLPTLEQIQRDVTRHYEGGVPLDMPSQDVELPPTFLKAHSKIVKAAHGMNMEVHLARDYQMTAQNTEEARLPSIYSFQTAGHFPSIEGSWSAKVSLPARFAELTGLKNMGYGALDIEDTTFMGWF